MAGGEADARRVLMQVGEAQCLRIGDERAEQTEPFGEGPDRLASRLVDTNSDEVGELITIWMKNPERAVTSIDELDGRLDHALEHGMKFEVRADENRRLEQPAETPGSDMLGRHRSRSYKLAIVVVRRTPPGRRPGSGRRSLDARLSVPLAAHGESSERHRTATPGVERLLAAR
jgi:hypothetical protein